VAAPGPPERLGQTERLRHDAAIDRHGDPDDPVALAVQQAQEGHIHAKLLARQDQQPVKRLGRGARDTPSELLQLAHDHA